MSTSLSAAESLEGLMINKKWKVIKKIAPKKLGSGGFFSVSYEVQDLEGNTAFLKALDFAAFFQIRSGHSSLLDVINEMTDSYKFERDLLHRCKNKKLNKVSTILDEGEVRIPHIPIINEVPFLVFEMADGDIRSIIDFSATTDYAFKVKSLHNVCVGLKQLHSVKIGHQDLKPSNILMFENHLISKIADLGRSICQDIAAPHAGIGFSGDLKYSPPEYLYGYSEIDWNLKAKAVDFYLFGSLIVYYFVGVNMTALILNNITDSLKPGIWKGDFLSVEKYLMPGFYKALDEFENNILNKSLSKKLRDIVEYCCQPNPNKRGIFSVNSSKRLDFERTIAKLDLIYKELFYKS